MFLRNVVWLSTDHTALYSTRQTLSDSYSGDAEFKSRYVVGVVCEEFFMIFFSHHNRISGWTANVSMIVSFHILLKLTVRHYIVPAIDGAR
jgi:hypothetical protein